MLQPKRLYLSKLKFAVQRRRSLSRSITTPMACLCHAYCFAPTPQNSLSLSVAFLVPSPKALLMITTSPPLTRPVVRCTCTCPHALIEFRDRNPLSLPSQTMSPTGTATSNVTVILHLYSPQWQRAGWDMTCIMTTTTYHWGASARGAASSSKATVQQSNANQSFVV